LRWGILGSGWIAERFIESVRAHTKQDLVAVGSRRKDRAETFASRVALKRAYGDYPELVAADDLDVIYVATPHNMHHEGVTWHSTPASTCSWRNPWPSIVPRPWKWCSWLVEKGFFYSSAAAAVG